MTTTKYILYAEDDEDDIDIFSEAFKEVSEYTLLTFKNGIDLLAFIDLKAADMDIQLIISDINMPLMNGIDTLRLLKCNVKSKNIPVCLYSTAVNAINTMIANTMNTKVFVKSSTFGEIKRAIQTMLLEIHEPIH